MTANQLVDSNNDKNACQEPTNTLHDQHHLRQTDEDVADDAAVATDDTTRS